MLYSSKNDFSCSLKKMKPVSIDIMEKELDPESVLGTFIHCGPNWISIYSTV